MRYGENHSFCIIQTTILRYHTITYIEIEYRDFRYQWYFYHVKNF